MKYVTAMFKYANYFPTVGFFIGLTWGFLRSNSNHPGSSGLALSMAIGGAVGLVVGVVAKLFAHYVTSYSHAL